MTLSMIVAMAEDNVIGIKNDLPWRLPADLKHFRNLTMHHHIIMGRKTFESIGKALPGRTSVVITRQPDFKAEGCKVVSSLEEAVAIAAEDDEAFIIGGAQIYGVGMKIADSLYVTRIRHAFEGDAWFPRISLNEWELQTEEKHTKDEKNVYDYTFELYARK